MARFPFKHRMKGPFHRTFIHIIVILFLTLLTYANSFSASFHFDDITHIVENPLIRSISLQSPSSAAVEPDITYDYRDRWVGFFTFALNYKLNGLDPAGYHIFNFVIHLFNVFLIYGLVRLTFTTPALKRSTLSQHASIVALFSSLLFAVHPVQSQAVTYIVQRFASLATFFYLLTLFLFIRFRLSRRTTGTYLYYIGALISAILAMKTKEIAFTLPLALLMYDLMFFDGPVKRRIVYLLPFMLTLLIIPLSLIDAGPLATAPLKDIDAATRAPNITSSRIDYLLTESRVLITYLRLLAFPFNQTFDYDYPVFGSLLSPDVLISCVLLAACFCFGVYLFVAYRDRIPGTRLVSFGIFWFFLTLAVESSLIPLHAIYEHRLYLPAAGLFMGLVAGGFLVAQLLRASSTIRHVTFISLAALLILTVTTAHRNTVWKSEITFWHDVVKKAPKKPRPHIDLGRAYYVTGSYDLAVQEFKAALLLEPRHALAHYNLALTLEKQGAFDAAISHYEQAVRFLPAFTEAHINLGNLYRSSGQADKAVEHYLIAAELDPDNADVHNNLGSLLAASGQPEAALVHLNKALALRPDYAVAHTNIGLVYLSLGKVDKARRSFVEASRLGDSEALLFLQYMDKDTAPGGPGTHAR